MKLRVRPAGAFLVVVGLAACDIPTGIPRWETTWITPGESTTVSVVELLPGGLTVNADTTAFVIGFDPVNDSWTLSELCSACPLIATTAPKPAFTVTVSAPVPLPADVQSFVLAGGDIAIALTNGFDFDPIRPGTASDSGSITMTVRSGTTTAASLVIDGRSRAFPPGATLNETLPLLPVTVADDLQVEFTFVSPEGDITTMDPADLFSVSIGATEVLVSEATIAVASQPIAGDAAELDLSDVDIADRLKEGTIFVEIENPFALSGTLNLTIDPQPQPDDPTDPAPITKPITLVQGTSETALTFTEEEIGDIVGAVSSFTLGGVVNADGGVITVRPDMVITVTTRLRVTVEVGGDPDDDSGF